MNEILAYAKDFINYLLIPCSALILWVWKKYSGIIKEQERLNGEFMRHLNNCPTIQTLDEEIEKVEKSFTSQHEHIMKEVDQKIKPIEEDIKDIKEEQKRQSEENKKQREEDNKHKIDLSSTLTGIAKDIAHINEKLNE